MATFISTWISAHRNPYPARATHICPSPKGEGRYGWQGQDMDFKGRYEGRYEISHVIIYLSHTSSFHSCDCVQKLHISS